MGDNLKLVQDNTKSGNWALVGPSRAKLQDLVDTIEAMREQQSIAEAALSQEPPPDMSEIIADELAEMQRSFASMDTPKQPVHTQSMSDITREEFNAKLETIEVKMDARVESVSAKIDTFLSVQAERDKRLDESLANIRGDISRLGSFKLSIWGAMFTGLAITLTVIGLGLTSYQAGQADRHPAEPSPLSQPQQPSK